MCIAFLSSIKFLEIFEISQKLKSFSSPRARKYISFSMLRFFRFFDQLYLREMTINDSFTHEFEMFFETFFSIKCYAVTTFTLSNQDPRFLPILILILILVVAKHTTLEDFLPSKIDEFVLFFRKRQPSKNMEERSVKIKLSFLTPLCGHTHTFLRIPLSKNLENSHGSALL